MSKACGCLLPVIHLNLSFAQNQKQWFSNFQARQKKNEAFFVPLYVGVQYSKLGLLLKPLHTILLVVKLCVLNRSHGYWLLLDALFFAFTLCISMKVDLARIQVLISC
jgi:hypothetical protein